MRKSKKISKLHITGLCAGNSPVAGEFLTQMTSNAEKVSIGWRHHGIYSKGRLAVGNVAGLINAKWKENT